MRHIDEKYISRCLQLAKKGQGATKTNPVVGCLIVHNNTIIGEGYHRKIGEAHAEVNAINSVKNSLLLKESTLYVSLEPCSHYGKTPPCAELIISMSIPRVVVAVTDPNPKVSGKGVQILRDHGVEVFVGVLENEARDLNRAFFINQINKRPYVTLKWAQTKDGFIDNERNDYTKPPLKLSNSITQSIVHKLRTLNMGIMVGTNTALKDNPLLNARKWCGENPVRIVIDRTAKIPYNSHLFSDDVPTIVFTAVVSYPIHKNASSILIDFTDNVNQQILNKLFELNIASVLIEGGSILISSFIESNLWDEAYVEVADCEIGSGIIAPQINGTFIIAKKYIDSFHFHIKNEISRN
ncbi:MAG: bifunctional diaminohydroxyphosphoribosylaminopyrimidine deaminase/5-amino-6-(5-phosphoribosylamino)uracil reductase RibD [Candidatus Saccharimonadaceae bacterium]